MTASVLTYALHCSKSVCQDVSDRVALIALQGPKADQILKKTGIEVRITVPGHTQRGGSPCPYDRVLSTRLGAGAAKLIMNNEYGYMVGIVNGKVKKVPLADVAGKLKMVDPDNQLIKEAKLIGISFGD